MIEIRHAEMVAGISKDGRAILDGLTPTRAHLWHMATGIAGEAGELLDAVKKCVIYGSELDMENVIEELGDLEFYMEGLRAALFLTRDQTLEYNLDKLSERYKGFQYTDQAAIDRADKVNAMSTVERRFDTFIIECALGREPVAGDCFTSNGTAYRLIEKLNDLEWRVEFL